MGIAWGALHNEWLKFRRRRRLALGVVVLLGITVTVTVVKAQPLGPFYSARARAVSARQEVQYLRASIGHDRGSGKLLDRMDLLSAQYALARATGETPAPLGPLVQAAHRVMQAAHGHNVAWAHYAQAVTAWKDARFAIAHQVALGPGRDPRSGWWLVSQVFSGPLVVLYALLALMLASDVLGMEFYTHTWNRAWLDPPGRLGVMAAKGALALGVAAGVLVVGAVLLYGAGTAAFGAGHIWVVSEVTYLPVQLHSYEGVAVAPFAFPAVLHPSQVVPATLSSFDVTAVLGTILPLAAILAAAALLGWLVHQPAVVALVAAAFAAAPNMTLNYAGQPWLRWVPGTYLPFGLWMHQGAGLASTLPGATPTEGLWVSAGWIAACAALVMWHARRVEL
ncbi:MAG: hypothetical protein M0Z54_11530 [Thermaerobacter sp.]|nr:hypothetical protein [Thermaerobacter sp.]